MLRVAPAAATVQLPVIWQLGGKFVASLLATSYPPDMCMWAAAELAGFTGMSDDGIITRHFFI